MNEKLPISRQDDDRAEANKDATAPDPPTGAKDLTTSDAASPTREPKTYLSQVDWKELRARLQQTLDQRIPPTPEHERLGIQDLARVTDLTVQQIRLLEHHGLVQPAFEISGEKRNRRYTREEAVRVLLAAEMIHQLNIRPGKAAMLVLARDLELDHGPGPAAPEASAAQRLRRGTALPPFSARSARHTHEDAADVSRPTGSTPGLDLFDVAVSRVRTVIAARLAATAVSALLGERDLPPQWVLHVRRPADDPLGAAPPGSVGAPAREPDGARQFAVLAISRTAGPEPGRMAAGEAGDPFYAFVASRGEVFSFSPSRDPEGQELLQDRDWYAITLPAAESYPTVQVMVGVPQQRHGGPGPIAVAQRLMILGERNGQLGVRRHIVEIAAALLWTVAEVIPNVVRTQSKLAHEGEIDLEALARRGVTAVVLWLYASVLVQMCRGADQCDVLAPYQDAEGGRTILRLIASSDLDESRPQTRVSVLSGQLLSGFAFSMAQPCYVEDVRAGRSALVSFQREERVLSAAAIPVIYNERPRACVYLSSRREKVSFTARWRRALEVAASEIAEVLLQQEVCGHVSAESILHAVRPHRIGDADGLRQVIEGWVEGLAARSRASEGDRMHEVDDETLVASDQDDRRLVMVVIGTEVEPHFREKPEIATWLETVARQAADSFAEALDSGAAEEHPTPPLLETDIDGDPEGGHDQPHSLTRVFRWQTRAGDPLSAPAVAYVVLAGDHCTRQHVERLKNLLHERGLDGQVVAQTAAEVPVGRVLGWVLDAKGSVVQRSLRPYHSGELDTQRAVESIVRDVHTCVRILPQQHQFHTEAFHDGNLDRAIITLKQALSQSSRDVYVLRHLLDLYVRTGRLDEALTLAEENRDREEAMPAKWFWSLGQVYLMLGDTDEALRRFDRALELDPSHPVPYRLIAEAHVVRNELHEAEEWLRRAIEREEARSMRVEERIIATYLMLGDVLAKQGRLDAAIATYEELQVTHPKAAKYNILVGERLTAARWQRRMANQARTQPPHAR